MTTPGEWSFYVARPECDQLFRRFAAGRGVAPPPPTLRASTALRFGFDAVRFAAVFAALRFGRLRFAAWQSSPCRSLLRLAGLGRLRLAGLSRLAFTGAMFLAVAREAARVSAAGLRVSCVLPLSSVVSVPSAGSFDSRRGSCVFLDRLPGVLRSDLTHLAAARARRRPASAVRAACSAPGFTLFCLLICGTSAMRPRHRHRPAATRLR